MTIFTVMVMVTVAVIVATVAIIVTAVTFITIFSNAEQYCTRKNIKIG